MTDPADPLVGRAKSVLPGGITRSTVYVPPHPPYAVSGHGARVRDQAGHDLIDCNNNYTALLHGHAHPRLVDAATTAIRSGSAFGLPTEHEIRLAEDLAERTGLPTWRFCNSGTEAVLMMLRAARAHTGRHMVVRFQGSYHGTGDELVPRTAPGLPPWVEQSTAVVAQGDLEAVRRILHRRASDVAAVLIDLIPNRAGLTPAAPDLVRELRELTSKHDVLLAVDEVISLRLSWGGFHKHYGITPDLISVGKIIGGGFPAGGVGGRSEVLRSFDPASPHSVLWGGTFTANPVTMSAGLTAMRLFDPATVSALNTRGDRLRTALRASGIDVNGFGSLSRILTDDTAALWWSLYRNGVLAGSNGLLALSTAMSDDDVEQIAAAAIRAVQEG